jgi:hypothetical protein
MCHCVSVGGILQGRMCVTVYGMGIRGRSYAPGKERLGSEGNGGLLLSGARGGTQGS